MYCTSNRILGSLKKGRYSYGPYPVSMKFDATGSPRHSDEQINLRPEVGRNDGYLAARQPPDF
jgi:hypothetical protein